MTSTSAKHVARPDTQDMVIVHRVFRREFRLLPVLVRKVTDGDTARADLIARHCDELVTALHHHHTGEDDLLWPRLRAEDEVDDALITRMENQHQRVAELLSEAQEALPVWRATADASTGERLAQVLDDISKALDEHLAQEERDILPLAQQYLTVAEWDELGRRGMASIPRNRLPVFLGHILEETTPAERHHMLANVPLPGRVAYRVIGQRNWRREVDVLRAGVQIPVQRRPE